MFVLRSTVADALPFSAGVTLYVAASDLIPEVNREPGVGMAVLVFLGVAAAGAEGDLPRLDCGSLPRRYGLPRLDGLGGADSEHGARHRTLTIPRRTWASGAECTSAMTDSRQNAQTPGQPRMRHAYAPSNEPAAPPAK